MNINLKSITSLNVALYAFIALNPYFRWILESELFYLFFVVTTGLLFVLSSKWEGFGNVLVEALACGCPVVSTDCPGGPREILKDGEYGELVPVGNPDLMSQAIINSLNSSIDTSKLRKRGYEFTQEKSVNKYVNYMFDYN